MRNSVIHRINAYLEQGQEVTASRKLSSKQTAKKKAVENKNVRSIEKPTPVKTAPARRPKADPGVTDPVAAFVFSFGIGKAGGKAAFKKALAAGDVKTVATIWSAAGKALRAKLMELRESENLPTFKKV